MDSRPSDRSLAHRIPAGAFHHMPDDGDKTLKRLGICVINNIAAAGLARAIKPNQMASKSLVMLDEGAGRAVRMRPVLARVSWESSSHTMRGKVPKSLAAAPSHHRPHACLDAACPSSRCARSLNIRPLVDAAQRSSQPPGLGRDLRQGVRAGGPGRTDPAHALRQMALAEFYELPRSVGDGRDRAHRRWRGLRAAAARCRRRTRMPLARGPRADPACQAGADRRGADVPQDPAGDAAAVAAAPADLADRAQFRPPARQLFRQFRRHRGRGVRRRRAAGAEPGPVHPELWRGRARPHASMW